MAIKEIFESNTDKIDLATQLLSELSDREGQYVWKKLTAANGTFVDYVTADSADAYPNGGTQDGCWYELFDPLTLIPENIRKGVDIWGIIGSMVEGYGAEAFGFSKISVTTLTVSSKTSVMNYKIPHELGVAPIAGIIYTDVNAGSIDGSFNSNFLYGLMFNYNWVPTANTGTSANAGITLTGQGTSSGDGSGTIPRSGLNRQAGYFSLGVGSGGYFKAGIEYFIILLA